MPRLFISHGSKDKAFVRKLTSDLEQVGIDVWVDEREIRTGDSIRQRIEEALTGCDFGVVVLSRHSIRRPWVRLEMDALYTLEAERKKELILPIVVDSVKVPLFIRGKKYADFSKGYHQGLKQILSAFLSPQRTWDLRTKSCEVLLDVKRLDGSLVRALKVQNIVSTREGIATYLDVCSSDGEITNIKVSPGKVIKKWKEIGTLYVESQFPRALRAGEKIQHVFDSDFVNSFCGSEEFWEERQFHPTERLKIEILFLKTRPPSRVWAVETKGSDRIEIPDQLTLSRRGGRSLATLRIHKPKLLATYQVFWRW